MRTSNLRLAALVLLSLMAPAALPGQEAKVDVYGDPLPAGAVARLGTVRWRHGDGTTFVAFLPDGKALLSVGNDGTVRQWDVATGNETRRFTLPGQLGAGIWSARFPGSHRATSRGEANPRSIALGADGKVLALTDGRSAVHLWDVAAGKELRRIGVAGRGALAIALTADSKTLAVQDADGTVRLHEVATGKETGRCGNKVDQDHPLVMAWVAISPDGKRLAADNHPENVELTVWETDTAKELNRQTTREPFISGHVEFSPDGKGLACTGDKAIVLADAASGKEVRRLTYRSLSGQFVGFLFAPDGKTLIAWERCCREFHVWETGTGKHLRRFRGPTLQSITKEEFRLAAISPDGKLLAVGGETSLICPIDVATGAELPGPDAHRLPLWRVSVSRDGKQVFTSDEGPNSRAWDAVTRKQLRTIPVPRDSLGTWLSGDGQWLVVIGKLGSMRRVEIATGTKVPALAATGLHQHTAMAVSSDGKLIAVGGTKAKQGFVVLYDASRKERHDFRLPASTRDATFRPNEERPAITERLFFSPDGRILAASLDGEKVALWDLTTGRELPTIKRRRKGLIRAVAFSADGNSLAVDSRDDAPCLYETATGQERRRYRVAPTAEAAESAIISSEIGDIAISPDRRLLAHSKKGGTITLWDVAGGKELGQLQGHQADVTALTFAADGRTLASGSRDTTVLLWDVTKFAANAKRQAAKVDAAARWNELAGSDAVRAFNAVCALAAGADQAVPFLKENLHPVAPVDAGKVQRLIADLDSERFADRKKASAELEKIGEPAIPLLRKALEGETSPEARKRIEEVLKKTNSAAPDGELLRSLRAVEVLETIGTAEAQAVLKDLAKGMTDVTVTRASQAALQRLGR